LQAKEEARKNQVAPDTQALFDRGAGGINASSDLPGQLSDEQNTSGLGVARPQRKQADEDFSFLDE
jgi:hypothetical protein